MLDTTRPTIRNVFAMPAKESARLSSNTLPIARGQWPKRPAFLGNTLTGVAERKCPEEWDDLAYRQAAVEATAENLIAWGVRVNREQRGLKQSDLAKLMGTGQSAISKLEDPEGGDVQLSTLLKAAHAFDCALLVRFVSHLDLHLETEDVRPERLLARPYSNEPQGT